MNRGYQYLTRERKLTEDTILDFSLGYYEKNTYYCREKELATKIKPYLTSGFRDRVVFPIFDLYSNLVAISARPIKDGVEPKYLNSTCEEGYQKGSHLYGLNVTYPYILESKEVVVVEGNFDLLSLYQSGIKNVVALLGSSLSVKQLCLAARFAQTYVLAFDGDEAGKKCTAKCARLLKQHNIRYKVVDLPAEIDPDSYVREYGADSFRERIRSPLQKVLKSLQSEEGV